MKITFFADDKKAFSKTGKILFTHFGLSGPLIMNSAKSVNELLSHSGVTAQIDMYPDTDFPSLEKNIIKVLDENKNKDLKNIFPEIVPHGLGETIFKIFFPDLENIKCHSFTKEDRKKLIHFLKEAPVKIEGLAGFERSVVSDGGIPLEEVDTRTMRSKIIPNLYLTGDILNINRPSGGYSLQLCWTSGFIAGSSIK
jgi:predicted Rossmann fold flavoprotein